MFFFFEDEYDAVEVETIGISDEIPEKEDVHVREIVARVHEEEFHLGTEAVCVEDLQLGVDLETGIVKQV